MLLLEVAYFFFEQLQLSASPPCAESMEATLPPSTCQGCPPPTGCQMMHGFGLFATVVISVGHIALVV